ncbi:hypothetical protein CTAYLR_001526 [Chrysophaeum taylorii]|uniref:Uncharacterized protein n=1 Tax=Chrysophaeum taylorii TaxID=2483200 RepID=A0AAD7UDM2_9STRA|nr:hypothetical protein CTAYLR_001526 [Chrysophaeum taylorii]
MLEAEREALRWEAFHSSLNVVERELNTLTNYLSNIGTQAALISGFVFATFAPVGAQAPGLKAVYYASASLTFGLMIYCLVTSTLVTSLGPTMALKGQDGSAMRVAVEYMKDERKRTFISFAAGAVCFEIVVIAQIWISISDIPVAIACTLLLLACFAWLAHSAHRIFSRFSVPESSPTTGQGVVTGKVFLRKAFNATSSSR